MDIHENDHITVEINIIIIGRYMTINYYELRNY